MSCEMRIEMNRVGKMSLNSTIDGAIWLNPTFSTAHKAKYPY